MFAWHRAASSCLLGLIVAMASCTHDPTSALTSDAKGGGALLGLAIISEEKECVLEFTDDADKLYESAPAKPTTSSVRLALPSGRYQVVGPRCDGKQLEARGRRPIPFTVRTGKIAYLGDLAFSVAEGGWTFRYGNVEGKAPAEIEKNAADTSSLLKRLDSVPVKYRKNIVSAYTGKAIVHTRKQAMTRVHSDELRISALASMNGTAWSPKPLVLEDCSGAEAAVNPVLVGEWKLTAYFQSGKLEKLDEKKGQHHTYSAQFQNCVRHKIKHHKPGVPAYVVYELNL